MIELPTNQQMKMFSEYALEINNFTNQINNDSAVKSLTKAMRPIQLAIQEMNKELEISTIFKDKNNAAIQLSTTYVGMCKNATESLCYFNSLPKIEPLQSEDEEEIDEDELNSLLNELGPEYSKILTGAWEAFNSNNPDRIRQSCISMRQLIDSVIDKRAPGIEDRKDQLKKILNGCVDYDVMNVFVKFVNSFIKCLGKGIHKVTSLNEEYAENFLFVGERILLLILKTGK